MKVPRVQGEARSRLETLDGDLETLQRVSGPFTGWFVLDEEETLRLEIAREVIRSLLAGRVDLADPSGPGGSCGSFGG